MASVAAAQSTTDSTDVFYHHLKLNEVTVTGVAGETHLKHSPAPITVVSGKDLLAVPATNIVDAIARQPGISALTTGSGIAKPIIRGLGYNRIVTLVDGVRQEGQQWGDEHGLEIDGQSVGSVEVMKGPASLMYGSDAMAGVVIFRPAPLPPLGKMRAQVSSEYQTNSGLFDYSVDFAGHLGGWVWDARLSQKMAHAYKNRTDGYVAGSQFQERAVSSLVGRTGTWGHSHLRLSYYNLVPSITEAEDADEPSDDSPAAGNDSQGASVGDPSLPDGDATEAPTRRKSYGHALPFQRVGHFKAVWDNLVYTENGQLKAVIGYQQNRRREFEESASEAELDFRLHTLTYDLSYQHAADGGWRLAVGTGGMWQRSLNKAEEALIPPYHLLDIGLYATANKRLERWTLSGGLRADHRHLRWETDELRPRRSFSSLTGSVGAVWNLTEHVNLKANVARGFRAPNLSELAADGVHEGTQRFETGTSSLRAERSLQLDLGADLSTEYVSAQLALFANGIQDFVYLARTDEPLRDGLPVYAYRQGDARLAGFEVGIDVHPWHPLHLGSTFSYVHAVLRRQPAEMRHLPFTPAPRWTVDVKYELTHDGGRLNNAYVAMSTETDLRQGCVFTAFDTETATPAYTLVNLSAGTDVRLSSRWHASVLLSCQNLFDRAYQSHLSRLKYVGEDALTGRRGFCNPGRNVVLKVVVPVVF